MTKELRPLLAAKIEDVEQLNKLQFPVLVSPKLDGIRLRIDPNLGGVSRTHKPIPNQFIQSQIADNRWMNWLDGEIIVGSSTAPDVFNRTQSAVMTFGGQPEWSYYIFDDWRDPEEPFASRQRYVRTALPFGETTKIDLHFVPQNLADSVEEVLRLEERYLSLGYEGIIVRSPTGRYKNGRSTFKEGILLKFKRVEDAEATVVGFEALRRNTNPQEQDAFGLSKRSSHLAGKVEVDLLGKLLVRNEEFGEFSIGSGFDESTRAEIWANQASYNGLTVSFKFQRSGAKDKPRFPIFKGFRHE